MIKSIKSQWKRRWLPFIIAYGGKIVIRLLLKTCRIEIDGLDHLASASKAGPCILMLWHSRLVIVSEILNKYTKGIIFRAFISKSRDGEPLAILAESYSKGRVLRVPHNSRHVALSQMIDTLQKSGEVVMITPDGPKGPKETIKPGVVVAARQAKALVVPFSWSSEDFWQLNTWDRMKIPKPFTTIRVIFGPSINLSTQKESDLEKDTDKLTSALKKLG